MNARTLIPLDRILQETSHITRRHTAFVISKFQLVLKLLSSFLLVTNSARSHHVQEVWVYLEFCT